MKAALAILAVLAIVVGIVWYEVALWQECLGQHSFFYCLRVLGQ